MDYIVEIQDPKAIFPTPSGLASAIYDEQELASKILASAKPYHVQQSAPFELRIPSPPTHSFSPDLMSKSIQSALGVKIRGKMNIIEHPLLTLATANIKGYMAQFGLSVDQELSEFSFLCGDFGARIDIVMKDNAEKRLVCELKSSLSAPLATPTLTGDHLDTKRVEGVRLQVADYANILSKEGYDVFDHALIVNVDPSGVHLSHFALATPFLNGHCYLSAVKCLREANFAVTLRYMCATCKREFASRNGVTTHYRAIHVPKKKPFRVLTLQEFFKL